MSAQSSSASGRRMAPALSLQTWQRLLGVVLLAAAGLKAAHGGLWLAVVAGEALLGVWLLSGLCAIASRWAACACFTVFLAVSLGKALAGETSCQCFGNAVTVSPWLTAGFNAAVVASLGLALTAREGTSRRFALACRLASTALLMVMVTAGLVTWLRDSVDSRPVVVLSVNDWLGQPVPLGDRGEGGEAFGRGRWNLFLYRAGCPACREKFSRWCRGANSENGDVAKSAYSGRGNLASPRRGEIPVAWAGSVGVAVQSLSIPWTLRNALPPHSLAHAPGRSRGR